MVFRITTSDADNVATEVQRLMAGMKTTMRHFRVSMAGGNSIVEFESEGSHKQQETILTQLNRQGVITEGIPLEGHAEGWETTGFPESQKRWRPVHGVACLLPGPPRVP